MTHEAETKEFPRKCATDTYVYAFWRFSLFIRYFTRILRWRYIVYLNDFIVKDLKPTTELTTRLPTCERSLFLSHW